MIRGRWQSPALSAGTSKIDADERVSIQDACWVFVSQSFTVLHTSLTSTSGSASSPRRSGFVFLGSGKLNQHKQRGVGQQSGKCWLFSASTVKFPSHEIKTARYSSGDLGKITQQPAQAVFCLLNLVSTLVMCSGAAALPVG